MYTTCSELGIFMYSTGNSMNNLLSYCGLLNARIRASDKDLPVSEVNLDMLLLSSCQNDYQGNRIQVSPSHPS